MKAGAMNTQNNVINIFAECKTSRHL